MLGVLPPTSLKSLAGNSLVATQVAESIDNVRATLMHDSTAGPRQVVMVTSPGTMEGDTVVASSLALSLSRAGRRTLLVDGDLRAPALHKLFGMPLEDGLSEVLRTEIDLADAIKPTNNERLYLLTAGVCDADAIHALATDQPQAIFEKLRDQFDFIMIDAPPVLGISDVGNAQDRRGVDDDEVELIAKLLEDRLRLIRRQRVDRIRVAHAGGQQVQLSLLVGFTASARSISDRSTSLRPSSRGMPNSLCSEGARRSPSTSSVRRPARDKLSARLLATTVVAFHRAGAGDHDHLPRPGGRVVHERRPHVVDRLGHLGGDEAVAGERLQRGRRQHAQHANAETFIHVGRAVEATTTEFQQGDAVAGERQGGQAADAGDRQPLELVRRQAPPGFLHDAHLVELRLCLLPTSPDAPRASCSTCHSPHLHLEIRSDLPLALRVLLQHLAVQDRASRSP